MKRTMDRRPIADAHADSLMWNRDLNLAWRSGHVDFPRLREARAVLQCFTVVTRGFPFVGGFPLFALWRRWPRAGRAGEWARALWQIERLRDLCDRSYGRVALTVTASGLAANLREDRLSAILGVEGAHAL